MDKKTRFGKAGKTAQSIFRAGLAVLLLIGCVYSDNSAASEKPVFFKDKRDGKKYRAVKIGEQTWMAKNLNYKTANSVCYANKSGNCKKYGRLYPWDDASGACPAGWHLPSHAEWTALAGHLGGQSIAGKKLKSTAGWSGENGNGTNIYEFSALPGGYGDSGAFKNIGYYGYWWSATKSSVEGAWNRSMDYYNENIHAASRFTSSLFSVRCLQD